MTIRDILADNFQRLKAENPQLRRIEDIVDAGGGARGTLGRITQKTVGVSIDMLDPLARAYGIEPWQLLAPNGTPNTAIASRQPPITVSQALEALRHIMRDRPSEELDSLADSFSDFAKYPESPRPAEKIVAALENPAVHLPVKKSA